MIPDANAASGQVVEAHSDSTILPWSSVIT
jgi:hypothetical protein